LPRVRDFKGLPKNAFDGRGNYTIGIKEQIIFTEINFDQIKRIRGFDITFVTSTNDDKQSFSLLKSIGLPFGKR
jgi:large subunit ribosomal protein L5